MIFIPIKVDLSNPEGIMKAAILLAVVGFITGLITWCMQFGVLGIALALAQAAAGFIAPWVMALVLRLVEFMLPIIGKGIKWLLLPLSWPIVKAAQACQKSLEQQPWKEAFYRLTKAFLFCMTYTILLVSTLFLAGSAFGALGVLCAGFAISIALSVRWLHVMTPVYKACEYPLSQTNKTFDHPPEKNIICIWPAPL